MSLFTFCCMYAGNIVRIDILIPPTFKLSLLSLYEHKEGPNGSSWVRTFKCSVPSKDARAWLATPSYIKDYILAAYETYLDATRDHLYAEE